MKKAIMNGVSKNSERLRQFPKRHILMASSVAACVMGVMALLPSADVEAKRTVIPMSIDAHQPVISDVQPVEETSTAPVQTESPEEQQAKADALQAMNLEALLGKWSSKTIKSGDNLSTLFQSQGLSAGVVYRMSEAPEFGKALADIRPGETFEFRINKDGELTQFRYVQSRLESIFFSQKDDGYVAEQIILAPEIRPTYANGTIEDSLFMASQKAGLSQRLTMELAGILGWDIDFVQDIRNGDSFTVLYEQKYLDGEKLGDGNILAATFVNQGTSYTAIRYTDSDGNSNYYSPDGKSMKKAFLRTPVEFTRISSKFNPNRLHPIFKTKRPHRAVDYAAPTNTPIRAAGDGKVKFAGWQKGYGNVVFIQHPNNIVTVYAHANKLRRGLKKGQRVKQGQVISYVGQTGWATGPHLHYEFRVNGVHRNPMTVKLPTAQPIAKKEMANFKKRAEIMVARLERYDATLLASNKTDDN